MKRVFVGFSLSVMIVAIAVAQNFRGGIKGVITDESGAVLASAVVKAANEATGLAYATLSSSAGEFAFHISSVYGPSSLLGGSTLICVVWLSGSA